MKLDIEVRDLDGVLRTVADVPRQAQYATMQAINATMLEVQAFTLDHLLPDKFTLRAKGAPWQKPGTKYGFNLKFANKTRLEGTLGSQAPWLDLQERGGVKHGSGGHRVAIPTPEHKPRREIMAAAKKPRALLKEALTAQIRRAEGDTSKKGVAKLKRLNRQFKSLSGMKQKPFLAKGDLRPGIYVREGRERLPIKALFIFEPEVPIEIRLGFEPAGSKLALEKFPGHFQLQFARAVATARRL